MRIAAYIGMAVLVFAVVQVTRENFEYVERYGYLAILMTGFEQFLFAYLVPSAFVYYNFVFWELPIFDFSPISAVKLLLNPLLFAIPRFLYPDKNDLLFVPRDEILDLDLKTVGGSSFINELLADSMVTLLIYYPVMVLIVYWFFRQAQRQAHPLYLYVYLMVLVNVVWFGNNLGFTIVWKVLLIQIVATSILFYGFVRLFRPR